MNTSLRELREDLNRVRATHPRRSSEARAAFERLFRVAAKAGQPLDALRRHTADETERFFAQTVTGADGHVYWDGSSAGFTRNDKKIRVPRRWWWAHKHGKEPGSYEDIVPMCGEVNCINPEHCEMGRGLRRPKQFTEEQMLNAIKVIALRIGHAPSTREWISLKGRPDRKIYQARFGNWATALRLAGLEHKRAATSGQQSNAADCVKSLRYVRDRLGHWPGHKEFRQHRELLVKQGLISSPSTVKKHLGSWQEAISKAAQTRKAA